MNDDGDIGVESPEQLPWVGVFLLTFALVFVPLAIAVNEWFA